MFRRRYLSRSAARLTRHRAFDFGGGRQVGDLKNQSKRNPKTTAKNVMADKWANAKSNQNWAQKLSKIIENRVWDHPGCSRGRLGDQFGPRAAQGSKRAPSRRESLLRFWHQNGDPVQLFVGFFFSVFLGARVADFSWFWVPEDPILASIFALLWELWAFGKTAESVVRVVNFRGFAPARLSLLQVLIVGALRWPFFAVFYDFKLFGNSHFESFWA